MDLILRQLRGVRRTRRGSTPRRKDDRPFPEEDRCVFPIENLYDRLVLPPEGRGWPHKTGGQNTLGRGSGPVSSSPPKISLPDILALQPPLPPNQHSSTLQ